METFGRYRIEALLGRGGMGEVHQAFDTRNERTVALKRLRSGLSDEDGFRTRFQRESRIVARLLSPHVIPIHDSGEVDGRLYLDMRLVRGRDLGALLAATGPMPPARASAIVGQVADALHSAHEDDLIHRDVKPSNVLLDERGSGSGDFAYLVDFGIAKSTEPGRDAALTGTGAAIGTLAYMSPEMFLGDTVDRRADVYALACMAFELLSGRAPFDSSGHALMFAHLHHPPPRLSHVRPGLPGPLDDVLAHGMAKRPEDRFATARELADALTRATAGSAAPVTRVGGGSWAVPAGATPGHGTPHSGPATWSGPGQVHFHGPGGTPWPGPGGARPHRRRVHPALIVVLSVLGALAIGASALVAVGLVGSGTVPNDQASVSALRSVFPRSGDAGCTTFSPERQGVAAMASIICQQNGTNIYYDMWPTAPDATSFFESYRAGRTSSDGQSRWRLRSSPTEQGAYYSGPLGAEHIVVAAYDQRRFSVLVVAPTREAAAGAFAAVAAVPVDQVPR